VRTFGRGGLDRTNKHGRFDESDPSALYRITRRLAAGFGEHGHIVRGVFDQRIQKSHFLEDLQ
jgi:hypothetical protein